jgi:hypothetical protein
MDVEPVCGLVIVFKIERERLINSDRRKSPMACSSNDSPNSLAKYFAEAILSRAGTTV